jgi:Helix-turn-helix domain
MENNPQGLLTREEAKARLGLTTDSAIYRLVRRGKLRAVKYSRTAPLRFRQIDVDACIEACSVTGPTPANGKDVTV